MHKATLMRSCSRGRQSGWRARFPWRGFCASWTGCPSSRAARLAFARWAVEGETGQGTSRTGHLISGQPLLRLRVRAAPMLMCQRCNQPFVYPVDNTVALQLVKSEEDLDEDLSETQDEDFADDLPEKVVGSHNFDLLAQVEDELILSVPMCPGMMSVRVRRPSPARLPKSPLSSVRRLLRCLSN